MKTKFNLLRVSRIAAPVFLSLFVLFLKLPALWAVETNTQAVSNSQVEQQNNKVFASLLKTIPVTAAWTITEMESEHMEIGHFVKRFYGTPDSLARYIQSRLTDSTRLVLSSFYSKFIESQQRRTRTRIPDDLVVSLRSELNGIILGESIFNEVRFSGVDLQMDTKQLLADYVNTNKADRINRLLLEDGFPSVFKKSDRILGSSIAAYYVHLDYRGQLLEFYDKSGKKGPVVNLGQVNDKLYATKRMANARALPDLRVRDGLGFHMFGKDNFLIYCDKQEYHINPIDGSYPEPTSW
ncbi:MAG: hypothetical protein JWM04_2772 [Verrucomicrobiales bacterium]|nr:hypothetical protein [Verrucomicrobiales bacterium]